MKAHHISTTLSAVSIMGLTIQGGHADKQPCGYIECDTFLTYCDKLLGDCVSCKGFCENHANHCQTVCPKYHANITATPAATITTTTTTPIRNVTTPLEITLDTPSPPTADNFDPNYSVFISFIILLVFVIAVLVFWRRNQVRRCCVSSTGRSSLD